MIFALIAAVSAGAFSFVKRTDVNQGHGFSGIEGAYGGEYKDFHHYPKYKFEYGVKDPHTHDHKSQWEMRDGDVVKGEYTLDEADGTQRVVSYHASDKTGFHADVKNIGKAHHEIGAGFQGGFRGF